MVHTSAHDKSAAYEGKYEADRYWSNEQFEGEHVAASDTLRWPGAMMVELFYAIVAETTMLC